MTAYAGESLIVGRKDQKVSVRIPSDPRSRMSHPHLFIQSDVSRLQGLRHVSEPAGAKGLMPKQGREVEVSKSKERSSSWHTIPNDAVDHSPLDCHGVC